MKRDYARTDEIDDALIPLDVLAEKYRVTDRTLRRWIDADGLTRHPYPGGKALRWGDIPKDHPSRWLRSVRSV